MSVLTKGDRRLKRRRRVRAKVSGTAQRPRISVFRSNQGLSAQLIDDTAGRTLAAVNWYEPDLRKLSKPERTKRAGETLAERRQGGRRLRGRVRPRRLPLPRPRPRLRRSDPRERNNRLGLQAPPDRYPPSCLCPFQ